MGGKFKTYFSLNLFSPINSLQSKLINQDHLFSGHLSGAWQQATSCEGNTGADYLAASIFEIRKKEKEREEKEKDNYPRQDGAYLCDAMTLLF